MINGTNRWYCFTINNYTASDIEQLTALSDGVTYYTYGIEKGENEGTPHLQGYIELTTAQRFSWLKKRLPRAHLEPRKGSRTQARDYCHKEDPNPVEYGTWKPDRKGVRNDLICVKRKIDDGASELDIATDHFTTWTRNYKAFARYRMLSNKRKCTEKHVLWLHGPSGSGKTKYAYDNYPNAYWKPPCTKWFDGYDGEETVIFDDLRSDWFSFSYMLRLLDRYPLQVECKGGSINFTPTTIVITAPCTPDMLYYIDEDISQLMRRISEIRSVG